MWGFAEYSNGAILIATASQVDRLDRMQRWFLHELGISDTEAFLVYNFAPPSLRRRIGILGCIHKRVLGLCHPMLQELLRFVQDQQHGLAYLHNRQILSHLEEVSSHARMYWRSLWLYVHIYNRLPQSLIDECSVQGFQTRLTRFAEMRAGSSDLS